MIKVNLVPKEILDRERRKQHLLQASVAAGVCVALVAAVSLGHLYRANSLEKHLAARNAEYETLKKTVAEVDELEKKAKEVRNRLAVITSLLKGRPLYPFFMEDLARSLPPGVWLTSLNTTTQEGNKVSLTAAAAATSSEAISEWLRALEKSGRFDEGKLTGISIVDKAGAKEHDFSVATTYANPNL